MRRPALIFALLVAVGTTGCLISTQIGERTHVNAPPPDEITFHFDTTFNRGILFGRSAALLLIPLWAFAARGRGGGNAMAIVVSVAALAAAGWLLKSGWATVFQYRVEVRSEYLRLGIPSGEEQVIRWSDIDSLRGEGFARDVSFGDGMGQAIQWAPEWEDLTITLTDGRTRYVDLRPLSVEQRGTLWRAIARRARLHVREWVETDST